MEKKDKSLSTNDQSQTPQAGEHTVNRALEARMKALEGPTSQNLHLGKKDSVTSTTQATNNGKHPRLVEEDNAVTGQTARFATPEVVLSSSNHETTSTYFSPSNRKPQKQHLAQEVESSSKGLELHQINKEKAAQFRAELAAERCPSGGPAPMSFMQSENATHFNRIPLENIQQPSEPTFKAIIPMMTLTSNGSVPSKVLV